MRAWLAVFCTVLAIVVGGAARATPYLDAREYGVKADGESPDDAALSAALDACATIGGATLWLPAGRILLRGPESLALKNCRLIGQGVVNGEPAAGGTTVLLTSREAPAFVVGSNWSIEGINFYWPEQENGTTPYPPLFQDDGRHDVNHWGLERVNIVNAYDGFAASAARPAGSWGDWFISNSDLYALHDLFRIGVVADSGLIVNSHFDPGPWLGLCGSRCFGAINAADQVNKVFHVTGSPEILKAGGVGTIEIANSITFAWRYLIAIDALGAWSGRVEGNFDGVGTLIDTSAGGCFNGTLSGNAVAAVPVYGGSYRNNNPAFDLGQDCFLRLEDFHLNGNQGSFIITRGQSVYLRNVEASLGQVNDHNDYYAVRVLASNGTQLVIENSRFLGQKGSSRTHGVKTDAAPALSQIVGNDFEYLNDDLDLSAGGQILIAGNRSTATTGPASVLISGGGPVQYGTNLWDKPPSATVRNCGAGATVSGGFAGFIQIGATVPTMSCQLTLPWTPQGGGGGACTFTTSALTTLAAGPTGTPPTWTIKFGRDLHGGQLFFNCPGQQ